MRLARELLRTGSAISKTTGLASIGCDWREEVKRGQSEEALKAFLRDLDAKGLTMDDVEGCLGLKAPASSPMFGSGPDAYAKRAMMPITPATGPSLLAKMQLMMGQKVGEDRKAAVYCNAVDVCGPSTKA